jgi:hypothetical protein
MIIGLVKMFFIFLPLVFLVYYLCYLVGNFLITQGLRSFLFVPALLAFMVLVLIAKKMFEPALTEIKKLRKND